MKTSIYLGVFQINHLLREVPWFWGEIPTAPEYDLEVTVRTLWQMFGSDIEMPFGHQKMDGGKSSPN